MEIKRGKYSQATTGIFQTNLYNFEYKIVDKTYTYVHYTKNSNLKCVNDSLIYDEIVCATTALKSHLTLPHKIQRQFEFNYKDEGRIN